MERRKYDLLSNYWRHTWKRLGIIDRNCLLYNIFNNLWYYNKLSEKEKNARVALLYTYSYCTCDVCTYVRVCVSWSWGKTIESNFVCFGHKARKYLKGREITCFSVLHNVFMCVCVYIFACFKEFVFFRWL